ncbi:MAG TPA: hypothetical protein VKB76_15740, partial [Ktedonobacterales bacterium]|nr:hypothetical protein [Ktedonobacterales bacterium]
MAVVIEQLLRMIALHPLFENAHMLGILLHLAHGDLVRTPITFRALAIDLLGAGPALGRAHD